MTISIEVYEERMRMLDVYAKLAAAEEQIEAGKVCDAEGSIKELREKYGL